MLANSFPHLLLSQFLQVCTLPAARINQNGEIVDCNPAFSKLARRNKIHATDKNEFPWALAADLTDDSKSIFDKMQNDIWQGKPSEKPYPLEFKSSETNNVESRITVLVYVTVIRSEIETPIAILQCVDNTEQRNLETRFAHSQKMQAVGQLAGGVAHDFNNLLTAMIGFCDLLLMRHPAGDPSFADIMQIKQNANRAANLVRQLLAFSRKQTLQPKIIDFTDVLVELSHLIRRLIGENIELNIVHGRDLGMIKADQGQLEQVVINLAVNARDAMARGGTLSIRTSNVTIMPQTNPGRTMISPSVEDNIVNGQYLLFEVTDTGCGIPRELIQQVFEPFFSTKEVGSGTGLGLSTVYGIVKQTGGYIYVSSTPGEGTTFHIYFPRHTQDNAAKADNTERPSTMDLTGSGTILLVEDETPVRIFASRALTNKGYTVLEADSAETALEIIEREGGNIKIIISDVVMPGMTGPEMVQKVSRTYPHLKVIFISGYAEDAFLDVYGEEKREFNFLPKPFTLKQLASKVKEVIES